MPSELPAPGVLLTTRSSKTASTVALFIGTTSGGVELDAWQQAGARFQPVLSSIQDRYDWTFSDDRLQLRATCPQGGPGCGCGFDVEAAADAPTIVISTESGPVRAVGFGAAELTVRTVDGAVDFAFSAEPASVWVGSHTGAIGLELPAGGYAFDVTTDGGGYWKDPALTDDPNGPPVLLFTRSGDIEVRAAR